MFGARRLAKLPWKANPGATPDQMFFESILTIHKQNHFKRQQRETLQVLKWLFGIVIGKTYFLGMVFGLVLGLDQLNSNGYRCRKLKNGTDFLLSNDTKAADYLGIDFAEIFEVKKENADRSWEFDQLNGLLSEYNYYDWDSREYVDKQPETKFSKISDLIEEFNAYGYHDVCNTLSHTDITAPHYLPPWFKDRNAKGRFNMSIDLLCLG